MKLLVFLAKGFETMEFSAFIDVCGWAKNDYHFDIEVTTCGFKKTTVSTFNIPVLVDKEYHEIDVEEYDAFAIPGGFEEYGFYEEAYDERLLKLVQQFHIQKKIIATICVASLVLGKSGILKDRYATTYHLKNGYRQKQLKAFGVHVINEPIVVDETIITSFCPQTAPYVAFKLLEMLFPQKDISIIKIAMGFKDEVYT